MDESWLKDVEKEYGSLERYVAEMKINGAEPLFFGISPFNYLIEKEFLEEHSIIRTNLEGGFRDGHYEVTNDGKLEGVDVAGGIYSGDKGVHEPEKILSLKRANNGWTVDTFSIYRICWSFTRQEKK